LKEFGQKILPLKEASHVNFKSLLTFLNIKLENINSIDIHHATEILRNHKKFTRINAMQLSMLYTSESVNYTTVTPSFWTPGPVLKLNCENFLNEEE
jgi:hypothetical protein